MIRDVIILILHFDVGQGIDTHGYCNFFVCHLFIMVLYKGENDEVVEAFVVVDHLDLFVENYKMNQTKIKMA
jgi:hypothetical protein